MPNLTVIAGCNGAGKSTFAPSFLPDGLYSFDFDRVYLENYNSLPDSEFRDKFAKDKTVKTFESSINNALSKGEDFCYETNFDEHPLYWPKIFKQHKYQLNLIFFCLNNQDIARHRIQVRKEFKGHFVDNKTIDLKWKAGYKNINIHFHFFDNILFVDNSTQNDIYTNILQIKKREIFLMSDKLPNYFKHRLPKIYKTVYP